jgi:hypothetical protein
VVPSSAIAKNFGSSSSEEEDEDAEMEAVEKIPEAMRPELVVQPNSNPTKAPNYSHTNEFPQPHSQEDTDFSRLLPIKISWNTKISLDTRETDDIPPKPSKHPLMVKLATLLNHMNEGRKNPVTILSSRSKIQLTSTRLLENWTNEDIKKHFEYTTTRYDRIQFTMWVKMQERANIWTLKTPILPHLIKHNIRIERHSAPMHEVHTTFIGWYGNDHHPDTTHFKTLQETLNSEIKDYYEQNQEELLHWARSTVDLQKWDGMQIPQVTVMQTNPYWHNNNKVKPQKWKTRATGLETKYRFRYFIRKIITAINAEHNNGNRTFIDTSMMGQDKIMDTAYGQAIHRHQQYLKNTSHRIITKISRETMTSIKSDLEAIEMCTMCLQQIVQTRMELGKYWLTSPSQKNK